MTEFRLVICTHDLAPEPVARGEELTCWLPFDSFLRLHTEIEAHTTRNGVTLEITSDDAFASDYELLFPWLVETGRTATFFVPTAYVGQPGRLTREQLKTMHAAGMRIGSHGTRHINWANAASDDARNDIVGGIHELEDMIGEPIISAAPPYGAYNRRVLSILGERGISEVYSCRGGYAVAEGRLRTRVAIAADAAVNNGIVGLSRRAPNAKDWLRTTVHRAQGLLN